MNIIALDRFVNFLNYLKQVAHFSLLGLNSRNLRYIRPSNSRAAIKIADDKLLTKKILERHGIPVQKIFAVVTRAKDLKHFRWNKLPASFVIKPNHGFGGGGIVVIRSRKKVGTGEEAAYTGIDKEEWVVSRLTSHIQDILDGRFSITNSPDLAIVEERIKLHPDFAKITFRGIPDIRVIVYNDVPVMAMLRLPTERSKGKANVSLGAVAVGLDLVNGTYNNAILKHSGRGRQLITKHPDTGADLTQIKVPFWDEVLRIAIRSSRASGLKYVGVDLAIDKTKGPVVMELNARPGLEIQAANLASLSMRLKRLEGINLEEQKKSIRVAKDLFGHDIERRVEDLSGRHVLGIIEKVEIVNRLGKRVRIKAKMDTGADLTSLDFNLAVRLGYKDLLKIKQEFDLDIGDLSAKQAREKQKELRMIILKKYNQVVGTALIRSSHGSSLRLLIPITFYLEGVKISTRATVIEREKLKYPMIIGRKNLQNFLIDPNIEHDETVRPSPAKKKADSKKVVAKN